MTNKMSSLRDEVVEFCVGIGKDPLLVQGAGGNVSWKDENKLWVKASGTSLSMARSTNIFVPVDMPLLLDEIESGSGQLNPRVTNDSELRPSIETVLHALMPHKIVVHLHAVNMLAYLVRADAEIILKSVLSGVNHWLLIEYVKPGPSLGRRVSEEIQRNPDIDVLLLKNHGIVVGGNTISEVEKRLSELDDALRCEEVMELQHHIVDDNDFGMGYQLIKDVGIQQLAQSDSLFSRLSSSWSIYPDHIVFLGPQPIIFSDIENASEVLNNLDEVPDLIFIKGVGVFSLPEFSQAKLEQLRCYYDVLIRVDMRQGLSTLSSEEIASLIDWDAEKYRLKVNG